MKAYALKLKKDEDGRFVASFPDVAGALTDGATEAEAIAEAEDALRAALVGYMELRQPVPLPKTDADAKHGLVPVFLPENVQIKILLWNAMLDAGLKKTELAKRLGKVEGYVRKLLDPYQNSTMASLVEAARALDKRIDMALSDAPAEKKEKQRIDQRRERDRRAHGATKKAVATKHRTKARKVA